MFYTSIILFLRTNPEYVSENLYIRRWQKKEEEKEEEEVNDSYLRYQPKQNEFRN